MTYATELDGSDERLKRRQRLSLYALRVVLRRHGRHCPPRLGRFAVAECLFRRYLDAVGKTDGVRAPRLASLGSARRSRDERRLLRAIAAVQADDAAGLDNQLYKLALDRQRRSILAAAVRAWVAAIAQPTRTTDMGEIITVMLEQPGAAIAETALLWSIRTWVACRRAEIAAELVIDPVFARLGAADAAPYFYGLMWTLQHGAARRIAVHCPCHGGVGADEQTLIDAVALTQERQSFERLLLLRTLLRPMASTAAGQSLNGLVRALNRGGLFLAPCMAPVRHYALPGAGLPTA